MMPPTATDPWWVIFGPPIVTLVVGWFGGRWFMSKKERKDFEQKNFENTQDLIITHDAAFTAYTAALSAYTGASTATAANFVGIATAGDRYFYQLNLMSAAILSNKVDVQTRDNVLLAKIRGAARTIERHYSILREISDRHGFDYHGELRREDYEAIYSVLERFGGEPEWRGHV